MICYVCKLAGDMNAEGGWASVYIEAVHMTCRGDTWCDCQHKTGPTFGMDMM